jgi:hypothetical protein
VWENEILWSSDGQSLLIHVPADEVYFHLTVENAQKVFDELEGLNLKINVWD